MVAPPTVDLYAGMPMINSNQGVDGRSIGFDPDGRGIYWCTFMMPKSLADRPGGQCPFPSCLSIAQNDKMNNIVSHLRDKHGWQRARRRQNSVATARPLGVLALLPHPILALRGSENAQRSIGGCWLTTNVSCARTMTA